MPKPTASKLLLPLLLCLLLPWGASAKDYLNACWHQQGQPLQARYLQLGYRETLNELEHNAAPWQATAYTGRGTVWCNADNFLKRDTLQAATRTYFSRTQRTAATLLFQDYGDQGLLAVSEETRREYVFRAARYSPVLLLAYFVQHRVPADKDAPAGFARYQATIGQTRVSLLIRRADALLDQVLLLAPDEMLGDVATSFTYRDYAPVAGLRYAASIHVEKFNGQVQDDVRVLTATVGSEAPALLIAPAGYQLPPASAVRPPDISVETFRPHLHFVALKHTDDRALVVEFDQFLLVAEAPLSSENGELIIREAQKIAPGKPIRYFVAGHHHPHYLGGLRPFVQRGATVLHGPGDGPYVRYLATAPHTLRPDSLQRHPRPLQAEEIQTSKTITDGRFEMQIFCIGAQSAHTNDYLIYYFPSEKLVFEDDLAALPAQGVPRKASARQAGLYRAIRALGLPVETVVQSWPVTATGLKTVFPFSDLEQSVK